MKYSILKIFNKSVLLVSFLFIFINNTLFADIYKGKIGEYPIYMEIEMSEAGDEVNATYFYEKYCKNIALFGEYSKGKYELKTPKTDVEESFVLTRENSNGDILTGQWQQGNKKLKVRLEKVKTRISYTPELEKVIEIMSKESENWPELDYIKIQFLKFKRLNVKSQFGKEFVWFEEPMSGVTFFRLGNGFNSDSRNVLNPVLDAFQYKEALTALSCLGFSYGEYSTHTEITYLSKDLLGIKTSTYYYCGGAYPDGFEMGFLFDINNGKEYGFDDIFVFGDMHPKNGKDYQLQYEYREKQVAPILKSIFIKNKKKYTDLQDECDHENEEYWSYFGWVFTTNGIEIIQSYPKALAPCREPFLFPYEDIRKYKNPTFPYEF